MDEPYAEDAQEPQLDSYYVTIRNPNSSDRFTHCYHADSFARAEEQAVQDLFATHNYGPGYEIITIEKDYK